MIPLLKLYSRVYYSIGGGFVVNEETAQEDKLKKDKSELPYPFKTAKELLQLCETNSLSIWELMLENEKTWKNIEDVYLGLDSIWAAMDECIARGCRSEGVFPGGLKVKRRASSIYKSLLVEARSCFNRSSNYY